MHIPWHAQSQLLGHFLFTQVALERGGGLLWHVELEAGGLEADADLGGGAVGDPLIGPALAAGSQPGRDRLHGDQGNAELGAGRKGFPRER